jgi:hypothetical protein
MPMRNRRYLLALVGTAAAIAGGAGAAAAASTNSTTATHKTAPRSQAARRYHAMPRAGHCPHMGAGHASGASFSSI